MRRWRKGGSESEPPADLTRLLPGERTGSAFFSEVRRVPELHLALVAVAADGGQELAVGAVGYAHHIGDVAPQGFHFLARLQVPDPGDVVATAGGELLAVG